MIHFVTGGTGFIGSRLILELLSATSDGRVFALSRSKGQASGVDRLMSRLVEAKTKYDVQIPIDEIANRLIVIEGDMHDLPAERLGIDAVWNTAGSLKHLDADSAEINRGNIESLENLVHWMHGQGDPILNHVSTAYVAGATGGKIAEGPYNRNVRPNNNYEKSKRGGEDVITNSGVPFRIFRPSIVVGDSLTFETMSLGGLYGFFRNVRLFTSRLRAKGVSLDELGRMTIITNPNARADLITVDSCVKGMLRSGLSAERVNTYIHLTNPLGPAIGETVDEVFLENGLKSPRFISPDVELDGLSQELSDVVEYFAPYIWHDISFEQEDESIRQLTSSRIGRKEVREFVRKAFGEP